MLIGFWEFGNVNLLIYSIIISFSCRQEELQVGEVDGAVKSACVETTDTAECRRYRPGNQL